MLVRMTHANGGLLSNISFELELVGISSASFNYVIYVAFLFVFDFSIKYLY